MSEEVWPELGGKEVRYQDRTWRLTGEADVRSSGDVVALDAREVGDVRERSATLYFDVVGEDSLNPGAPGDHFDSLERTEDGYVLVVKEESGKRYRYALHRLEFE